ncbi:uncharacterized protein [Diadema antillarum]|uniref:uncharacterized protein n=1 Tax=Diadema antillarum TaxID=105358 RepID=UPI003A87A41E
MLMTEAVNNSYYLFDDANSSLLLRPNSISVQPLNQCNASDLNDCSEFSDCIDTQDAGGFTCQCWDGYEDYFPAELPGRVCGFNYTLLPESTTIATTTSSGPGGTLAPWQVAVLIVGVVVGAILLALCCLLCLICARYRRRYGLRRGGKDPVESGAVVRNRIAGSDWSDNFTSRAVLRNPRLSAPDGPEAFYAPVIDGSEYSSFGDRGASRYSGSRSSMARRQRDFQPGWTKPESLRAQAQLDDDGNESESTSRRRFSVDPVETSIMISMQRVLRDVLGRMGRGGAMRPRVPEHLASYLRQNEALPGDHGLDNGSFESDPYYQQSSSYTPDIFYARVVDGSEMRGLTRGRPSIDNGGAIGPNIGVCTTMLRLPTTKEPVFEHGGSSTSMV